MDVRTRIIGAHKAELCQIQSIRKQQRAQRISEMDKAQYRCESAVLSKVSSSSPSPNCFGDTTSLCSPSWSGTHYVAQVDWQYFSILSARISDMSHQTSSNEVSEVRDYWNLTSQQSQTNAFLNQRQSLKSVTVLQPVCSPKRRTSWGHHILWQSVNRPEYSVDKQRELHYGWQGCTLQIVKREATGYE